jgi:thiopeptide-type bacteriocin biosynthesis protein
MKTDLSARQFATGQSEMDTLYRPLPWAIVRTPLLPLDGPGALNPAAPLKALAHPRVRQALAIGSPSLLAALERSDAAPKAAQRARRKLLRYLIRMSSRPTPYGTFAAVSLATWGPRTSISLDEHGDRTRTRPDMGWLAGLVAQLESQPEVMEECSVRSHPAAFVSAGRVQVSHSATGPPLSIRATRPVLTVLSAARTPIRLSDLRQQLLDDTTGSPAQVDELLTQLVRQHVLLTDLRPTLTCASPARRLLNRLMQRAASAPVAAALGELLELMAEHDDGDPADAPLRLRRIGELASELHAAPEQPTVQVDLARPLSSMMIGEQVWREAAKAAELLLMLSSYPAGPPELEAYRRTFIARYGYDRQVPLLEMLDSESGIGPMGHSHAGGLPARALAIRASALQDLAVSALRDRQLVVELDQAMIENLRTCEPTVATAPMSLELSVFVAARNPAALDRGDFLLVVGPNLGAGSAGRSLGRFADLLGEAGRLAMAQVTESEREALGDGWSSAEVVYLPSNARSGNVIVRPQIHAHEIVVNTEPGVAETRAIRLDDLIVEVDESGFRVCSRSLRVNVMPSAKHMLNRHHAPASCQFLDAVAQQGRTLLTPFDWGAAADFPFLPRIQCGQVVLMPAQWKLRGSANGPGGWATHPRLFADQIARWRTAWSVPARVYLTMADNRLMLDLTDPGQMNELRAELGRCGKDDALLLQEALPGPDQAWLPGGSGTFMSELVVPLVLPPAEPRPAITDIHSSRNEFPEQPPAVIVRPDVSLSQRIQPPGSEWLFVKLYCPRTLENDLLSGPVASLCEMAEAAGLAANWFFIRYADPESHLRLRWRGDPDALLRHLMPHACEWANDLVKDGIVKRFVFDTYDRELERYGGRAGIEISERVWWADSRAVLRLLGCGNLIAEDLTELAMLTADDLLSGLGLDKPQRLERYSAQAPRSQATGAEFRTRQSRLRAILGASNPISTSTDPGTLDEILMQRRAVLEPAGSQLNALAQRDPTNTPLTSIHASHVHLHCNRLLGGRAPDEATLLELLHRTHLSLAKAPLKLLPE